MKTMKIIAFSYMIIGCLFLLYFAFYAFYAGLTNSFTYFWLLAGILFMGIGILTYKIEAFATVAKILTCITLIVIMIIGYYVSIILKEAHSKPAEGATYMIVLGAQVKGVKPSYSLKSRLKAAEVYMKENQDTVALLSGGQGSGEDITEAWCMRNYLVEHGISEERLILEEKSTTTDENIAFCMNLMDEEGSVVIVTNGFHVYRSLLIAKKRGLSYVSGLGTKEYWYTIPNMYVREAFAIMKYQVCGQI